MKGQREKGGTRSTSSREDSLPGPGDAASASALIPMKWKKEACLKGAPLPSDGVCQRPFLPSDLPERIRGQKAPRVACGALRLPFLTVAPALLSLVLGPPAGLKCNREGYSYSEMPWWICPGNSGSKESACNAEDPDSTPGSGRSLGEGNGHPLQYSCLKNPMDRGVWRAIVHGVANSQTQLND